MMRSDNFAKAKALAAWKAKIIGIWNTIEVIDKDVYNTDNQPLPLGEEFTASITLDITGLQPEDVGVELLIAKRAQGMSYIIISQELKYEKVKSKVAAGVDNDEEEAGQLVKYTCKKQMKFAGVYEYGFRIFPKNDLLPHRQDFSLVKWI